MITLIHVAYEHPPRSASFYLLYFVLLSLILFPLVLIVTQWTSHIAPSSALLLLAVLIFLRLSTAAPSILLNMITVEDVGLPKDTDISDKGLQPPDTLADAIFWLELEGFERFGEFEALAAGQKQPYPAWVYRSSGGQIAVTLLEIGQPPGPFIGFHTFAENGVVQTTYPRGHQLKVSDARFSGVNSNVEAAYRHHVEEVRAFKPQAGRIFQVSSLRQYFQLDSQYAPQFKKLMFQPFIDHVLIEFCLSLALTPGMLLFAGFLFPGTFAGVLAGERLVIGTVLLVVGLGGGLLVGMRTRGVKGSKRQG